MGEEERDAGQKKRSVLHTQQRVDTNFSSPDPDLVTHLPNDKSPLDMSLPFSICFHTPDLG